MTTPLPDHELYVPEPALRPYVKYIRVLRCGGQGQSFRFFADGCPGVIFHRSGKPLEAGESREVTAPFFLYGQTVRPIDLVTEGSSTLLVFYFYPHVLRGVFGFNAQEITDACVDLSLLPVAPGMRMAERLQESDSMHHDIGLISGYLLQLIALQKKEVDGVLQYAVTHLLRSKGEKSLRSLHKELCMTERTFERRFSQYIGVSPRMFSKICRFQASLNQLKESRYDKLSDVAFENGYTDQSHFIRTFREFTGFSPLEFTKQPALQFREHTLMP